MVAGAVAAAVPGAGMACRAAARAGVQLLQAGAGCQCHRGRGRCDNSRARPRAMNVNVNVLLKGLGERAWRREGIRGEGQANGAADGGCELWIWRGCAPLKRGGVGGRCSERRGSAMRRPGGGQT